MLGFLIPDILQRLFVDWVGALPLRLQTVCFAALCAMFLLIAASLVRLILLHLDCELAYRSRLNGAQPNSAIFAIGWIGYWQAYAMIIISIVFILSAGLFDAVRSGVLTGGSDGFFVQTIRIAFLCLRPGSGNQPDNLSACPILG